MSPSVNRPSHLIAIDPGKSTTSDITLANHSTQVRAGPGQFVWKPRGGDRGPEQPRMERPLVRKRVSQAPGVWMFHISSGHPLIIGASRIPPPVAKHAEPMPGALAAPEPRAGAVDVSASVSLTELESNGTDLEGAVACGSSPSLFSQCIG